MHDSLEEVEDERGYRFYVNKTTKIRYKENPTLILIMKRIKSVNQDIKYSSYRSAIKLIHLKNALHTHCIPFQYVVSIIDKHKSGSSESVNPSQLTSIIHDIFFAAEKAGLYIENIKFDLSTAISVFCNLMWNVFDSKRQTNLSLMELKLTMLILCELNPINTYQQLIDAHFEIAKDHNSCITRARFEEFINIFSKILTYLGESIYFEQKVTEEIVNSSFSNYPGINGISHFSFTSLWMSHETSPFSTYTNLFLLLIRFKKSELVVHQNQCVSCNKFPIVGMRFKCQKCKGLSLCFTCFSRGFVSARHTNAHRMFELTTNEKHKSKFVSFMTKICDFFTTSKYDLNNHLITSPKSDENSHEGYNKFIENEHVELFHADDDIEVVGVGRKRSGTIRSEIFDTSGNALIAQKLLTEKLHSLIDNLKSELQKFENSLISNTSIIKQESLVNHKSFMVEQIDQLENIHHAMTKFLGISQNDKTIKSTSLTSPTASLFIPHSSTPYQKLRRNLKDPEDVSSVLNSSMNGCDFNKSFASENADVSISDVSCWFQTQASTNKGVQKPKERRRSLADETFETKVANFRNLLMKVKEIIDDSYSDNKELAITTENLERVVIKIIDDEEKKRSL